ncbi:MAG: phosphoribosylformylglycinamidine synthase, partial [Chlamydiia bacterium]|nr:phosphoribosylformylglycinamidine synthase [Chlamydiia bacterium]
DATKCVTSDFKRAGDLIYLLGETKEDLGGSSLLRLYRIEGGSPPKLNAHQALERYRNLHRAIALGLVASCHDLSDGGLGVALAESAFGGGLGAQVDLSDGLPPLVALYAESLSRLLVTVSRQNQKAFEELCAGTLLGSVTAEPHLVVSSGGKVVLREHLETLQAAWRNG